MRRTVRRMVYALVVLAGAGAFASARRRRLLPAEPTPLWPPFDEVDRFAATTTPPPVDNSVAQSVAIRRVRAEELPRWVAPVNGECPDGYPVKANDNSGIFHVPGGRFYSRTVPERCYANSADALVDGYRAAKA